MDNGDDRLLRMADVVKITTLSRSTVKRKIQAGDFPAPLVLGELSLIHI